MSIDTKSFDNILSKIIKSESGIKKVILVDRTGLTIASVSKFSYFPADVDGIGAIASAVFCASEIYSHTEVNRMSKVRTSSWATWTLSQVSSPAERYLQQAAGQMN